MVRLRVRASGQGGGSINNFKIVSDKAAVSAEENYIAIDGQKSGDNLICRLRLNGSNRFKFYNEGFAPEASNKNLGGNSSSARWKGMYGKFLDLESFNCNHLYYFSYRSGGSISQYSRV